MKNVLLVAACLVVVVAPARAAGPGIPEGPLAQRLPVEIVLSQQELGYDVPNTGKHVTQGVGGLLGLAIGNAIDKAAVNNREERVAPLRNLLLDYPFNPRMEAALRAKLPSDGLSPEPQITRCSSAAGTLPLDVPVGCSLDPMEGVLLVTPRYSLDNKFRALTVKLDLQHVDRTLRSNGKPKIKVRRIYTYHYSFPIDVPESNDADENAALWATLDASALKTMLDYGITQVTDMVAYDFSPQGRTERIAPEPLAVIYAGGPFDGRPVRQDTNWIWTRQGRDLHGYYPVSASKLPPVTEHPAPSGASLQAANAAVLTPPAEDVGADAAAPTGTLPEAGGEEAVKGAGSP